MSETCRVLYQINQRNSASRCPSLYEYNYTNILLLYNLSIISDKIYNANMLLKYQCIVMLELCYNYYNTRQLLKSAASSHLEIVKSL